MTLMDERTAFEAWAKSEELDITRFVDTYDEKATLFAWEAWQARAALAQQPTTVYVDVRDAQADAVQGVFDAMKECGLLSGLALEIAEKTVTHIRNGEPQPLSVAIVLPVKQEPACYGIRCTDPDDGSIDWDYSYVTEKEALDDIERLKEDDFWREKNWHEADFGPIEDLAQFRRDVELKSPIYEVVPLYAAPPQPEGSK